MENPENEVKLIRQQIQGLEAKKFDLEAWKSTTLVFVSRIFGPSSEPVRQIRELKYDYSSWSLRDTSGGVHQTDPVKTRAREILEAAITDLENFGKPGVSASSTAILDSFQKELTGKEMDKFKAILTLTDKEKKEKLNEFILSKEKELLASVLVELIMSNILNTNKGEQ